MARRYAEISEMVRSAKGTGDAALRLALVEAVVGSLSPYQRETLLGCGKLGRFNASQVALLLGKKPQTVTATLNRLLLTGMISEEVKAPKPYHAHWYRLSFPWQCLVPADGDWGEGYVRSFRMGPQRFGQWFGAMMYNFENGIADSPPRPIYEVFPQLVEICDFGFFDTAFPQRPEYVLYNKSRTFEIEGVK